MKLHIDARTGEIIPQEASGGLVGFISWRRLQEVLREASEVRSTEKLLAYEIDERGITFRVTL